jgi:hypothetical protein
MPLATSTLEEMMPIAKDAGWDSQLVWTGTENLAPPLGFNYQTIQPIAGYHTNYTIPAAWEVHYSIYIYTILKQHFK